MSTEHHVIERTDTTRISIAVNGTTREVRDGETIADLVRDLALDPERLAVELDRRIVKRAQWPSTRLAASAQVEIVQFVGGG